MPQRFFGILLTLTMFTMMSCSQVVTAAQIQPAAKSVVLICGFDTDDIPAYYAHQMKFAYLMSRTAVPNDISGDYNTFPLIWTKSALLSLNAGNRISTTSKRRVSASEITESNTNLIYRWKLGLLADSLHKSRYALTTWDMGRNQTASLLALGGKANTNSLTGSMRPDAALAHAIRYSPDGLIVFAPKFSGFNRYTQLLPVLDKAMQDKLIDGYVLLRPVGTINDEQLGVRSGLIAVCNTASRNMGLIYSHQTRMLGYITLSDVTSLLGDMVHTSIKDETFKSPAPKYVDNPNAFHILNRLHANLSAQRNWDRYVGGLPSLQMVMLVFAIVCVALGFRAAAKMLSVWPYVIPTLGITVATFATVIHLPIWIGVVLWTICAIIMMIRYMHVSPNKFTLTCSYAVLAITAIYALLQPDLLRWTGFGYSPQEGARYYGIGNEMGGILTGAVAIIAYRYRKYATFIIALWLIASGLPFLGAKVGSMLGAAAMLAAYLFINKWQSGKHKQALAYVGIAVVLVAVISAYAFILAPDSHLGIFLHDPENWDMIFSRKWAMNMKLLEYSPWATLMLVSIVLMVGLPAWMWAGVLALFLLNDSGVVAAATMASWLGVWNLNDTSKNGPIDLWGDLGRRLQAALAQKVEFPKLGHRNARSDNDLLK